MFMSISRRTTEPIIETLLAASPPFWLMLQPLGDTLPVLMVIIIVDEIQPVRSAITAALILSDLILLKRENIRITVENSRADTLFEHDLDYCTGTRGTARMEKDLGLSSRNLKHQPLFTITTHSLRT